MIKTSLPVDSMIRGVKGAPLMVLVVSVLLIGLPPTPTTIAQEPSEEIFSDATKSEIESVLRAQAKAWNEGSLERFMETYWKSDKLTFSGGGKTTNGWQATLDNYRNGYAPPKEMGKLHFDKLNVMMIESKSALVLGDWHLRMNKGANRDGNFSLVLKKFGNDWKIIHDHSSTLEAPKDREKPGEK